MPEFQQETDLVLSMGTHAFILNTTTGNVNVYVGPMKKPLSPKEEVPVTMNGAGRYEQSNLEKAIKTNVLAQKGEYVILKNPAVDGKKPKMGVSSTIEADFLRMGEMVNIPGPCSFAPWPGQVVQLVPGHHLKSNQYLLVRVYDEDAARANWTLATIKPAAGTPGGGTSTGTEDPKSGTGAPAAGADESPKSEVKQELKVQEIDPNTLLIGQLIIIKGTDVSFYIPPTGVEVLKDGDSYVRDALTLESLEYCLLIDEDGNKRYERGPQVVFPAPTESFKLNDDRDRKSRAYELNEISGLHIKVIAPYTDEYGRTHFEGEELFITGRRKALGGNEEETQIYFPRVEHALLKYGGRTRYHAVAIPPGDARYVMDRLTGKIRLEHGPSMFLPDPRKEVIVRRPLSEDECNTYFPGNKNVADFNRELRERDQEVDVAAAMTGLPSYRTGHAESGITFSAANVVSLADSSASLRGSRATDVIERGTKFTPPREIVLGDKFGGVVKIRPWSGFAVQVVDQDGHSRVETWPRTVQLEFDERLEILSLSTGTPKSSDRVIRTPYLRIANNAVSDVFLVKTKDLVPVKVHLKYLVRFEESQREKWFTIDNYVQNMVDRFRSLVNNYARTVEVQQFYVEAGALLRDLILGKKSDDTGGQRPGFSFEENGMLVYELNVLGVEIQDNNIAQAMRQLQTDRITNSLEAERSASTLALATVRQENARLVAEAAHQTAVASKEIQRKEAELEGALEVLEVELSAKVEAGKIATRRANAVEMLEVAKLDAEAQREHDKPDQENQARELDNRIKELVEQANADKSRIEAVQPQLTASLVALAQTGALNLVAKHLGDLAIVRNQSLGGMFETMFKGTPLEGMLDNLKQLGVGAVVSK